jgi:hypothetical protein
MRAFGDHVRRSQVVTGPDKGFNALLASNQKPSGLKQGALGNR